MHVLSLSNSLNPNNTFLVVLKCIFLYISSDSIIYLGIHLNDLSLPQHVYWTHFPIWDDDIYYRPEETMSRNYFRNWIKEKLNFVGDKIFWWCSSRHISNWAWINSNLLKFSKIKNKSCIDGCILVKLIIFCIIKFNRKIYSW